MWRWGRCSGHPIPGPNPFLQVLGASWGPLRGAPDRQVPGSFAGLGVAPRLQPTEGRDGFLGMWTVGPVTGL